jgi:uncharacterized PurR-regulated membrane protein YhhQ (DUF165 family)
MNQYINEIIFIFQISFIAAVLNYLYRKKNFVIAEQLILSAIIFMNLLGAGEVIIFGLHASIVEPLGVACYFLTLFTYRWDRLRSVTFVDSVLFSQACIACIISLVVCYSGLDTALQSIALQYIKNLVVSLMTMRIAVFIERRFFDFLRNKIADFYAQFVSIALGQAIDTACYTLLIFYDKSFVTLCQIFSFSYIVKLASICFYTGFLPKQ